MLRVILIRVYVGWELMIIGVRFVDIWVRNYR